MMDSHDELIIDARQQPCPMPILLLKKWRRQHPLDDQVLLMATDPNSQQDLHHFCQVNGYAVIASPAPPGEWHYQITFDPIIEK